MEATGYPCPDCGFEGPHHVYLVGELTEPTAVECGDTDCATEFEIPSVIA